MYKPWTVAGGRDQEAVQIQEARRSLWSGPPAFAVGRRPRHRFVADQLGGTYRQFLVLCRILPHRGNPVPYFLLVCAVFLEHGLSLHAHRIRRKSALIRSNHFGQNLSHRFKARWMISGIRARNAQTQHDGQVPESQHPSHKHAAPVTSADAVGGG